MTPCTVFLLVLQTSIIVSRAVLVDDATCQSRCGSTRNATKPCQCNSACIKFKDCCTDYTTLCSHTGGRARSCLNLTAVSEELWASDVNRMSASDVTVNYQTKVPDGTKTDNSTEKLFTYVNEAKLGSGTYKLLSNLMNNYDPVKGARETATAAELAEDNAFLDAILATTVMEKLLNYLTCRGLVKNKTALRTTLKRLWFNLYSRNRKGTTLDTCGFEHMMVGEYKDRKTVNGFHNWVSFYQKEKAGTLNYFGYVSQANPSIIGAAFSWDNRVKTLGSFFIGVSPEFELAIYSLCFLSHPGGVCNISLNGSPVRIVSYSKDGHIATAYVSA